MSCPLWNDSTSPDCEIILSAKSAHKENFAPISSGLATASQRRYIPLAKSALWVTRRLRHILSLRMLRAHTLTRSIIIRRFTSPIIATNKTVLKTHFLYVLSCESLELYAAFLQCTLGRVTRGIQRIDAVFLTLTSLESASQSGAPPQASSPKSRWVSNVNSRCLHEYGLGLWQPQYMYCVVGKK
jgi:hypothetical protein